MQHEKVGQKILENFLRVLYALVLGKLPEELSESEEPDDLEHLQDLEGYGLVLGVALGGPGEVLEGESREKIDQEVEGFQVVERNQPPVDDLLELLVVVGGSDIHAHVKDEYDERDEGHRGTLVFWERNFPGESECDLEGKLVKKK